jgi:hypothetical protein
MKKKNNKMSLSKILFAFIAISVFAFGCSPDLTPSLYDSVGDKGVAAEITSVSPANGYSGVTTITITGKNFSTVLEENSVYFSSKKAQILSGSTTELVVKAPIILGDSLRIFVGKVGVENFSNSHFYKLAEAVNEHYPFLANQEPLIVTSDDVGNIYFQYQESSEVLGIWQISSDGILSRYSPKKSSNLYSGLKYHYDNYLLGVASTYKNNIVQISKGDAVPVFWATGPNNLKFVAIDFDENKNVWVAGTGGKIVRFATDKSWKAFDYVTEISSIRIFNNYLYAISGSKLSFNQNIVRFPILSSDSLGAVETYFQFSENVPLGVTANSLTFAADGQMYIAISPLSTSSNPIDPIMYLNTDGSFGVWYPGLITSSISNLAWGTGTEMYAIRKKYITSAATPVQIFNQSILRIDMERLGAPEYGRD